MLRTRHTVHLGGEIMYNVWAAVVTVGGMVLVSMFSMLATRWSAKEETERLRQHLLSDSRLQQHREWEAQLRDHLSEIIALADPQLTQHPDRVSIITLVHRSQLLLNESDPAQAKVNGALNALALEVTGWSSRRAPDAAHVLSLQNDLINAAKMVVYNPSRQ